MNDAATAALHKLRTYAATFESAASHSAPLTSIFSELYRSEAERPPPAYLAAQRLKIEREILFPVRDAQTAHAQADAQLATKFKQAYAALQPDSEQTLEQLYYLLHEYAWAVPSQQDAAVSLFDHARVEAAIAAATVDDPERLLLLGGDISGIQDFLYTLPAAGATRALRGRSFYLQMLTDAVAHYLLRQCGMPLTNLLYSGGGRFYLVLPAAAETELERWRRELGLLLLNRHNGELYIAIGCTVAEKKALSVPKQFETIWGSLLDSVSADKRRRFAALDPDTLTRLLFTPQGHGGDLRAACVVCRYQGETGEFRPFKPDKEAGLPAEQIRNICKLCWSFDYVARDLHNADFLVLTPREPRLPQRRERVIAYSVLRDLGLSIRIARNTHIGQITPSSHGSTRVLGLKGRVDDAARRRFGQAVFGIRSLVNETPQLREHGDLDDPRVIELFKNAPDERLPEWNRDVKTFGILTQQSTGIKRLGVLRMDVDNLGSIFRGGIHNPSLARTSALSAAMSRFFEGWVGWLCRDVNDKQGQRIYAVYSGGDDLFIVGSWELLPELAQRIHNDLDAYALNPKVHISAGISLHGRKFPLYQAASAAHDELERAKSVPDKNAWGFLGQVVYWGEPADEVFKLYQQLTTHIGERGEAQQRKPLSRAVLQVLQELYSQYAPRDRRRSRDGETTRLFFGPWIWRGVYQLTRMAETRRKDKNPEIYKFLTTICERLGKDCNRLDKEAKQPAGVGQRYIERVGLAARWAQLYLRKEQP